MNASDSRFEQRHSGLDPASLQTVGLRVGARNDEEEARNDEEEARDDVVQHDESARGDVVQNDGKGPAMTQGELQCRVNFLDFSGEMP